MEKNKVENYTEEQRAEINEITERQYRKMPRANIKTCSSSSVRTEIIRSVTCCICFHRIPILRSLKA